MANFTNLSIAKLAAGIDDAATEFTIETGKGVNFPDPANGEVYGWIWDAAKASPAFASDVERVKIGARVDDTFSSVLRGQLGTTAVNHNTVGHDYYFMVAADAEWLNKLVAYSKYAYLEASSPTTVSIIEQRGFVTPLTAEIVSDVLTITSVGEFNTKTLRQNSLFTEDNLSGDGNTITVPLWDSFDDFSMEIKLK